jgi:hypothetical protein
MKCQGLKIKIDLLPDFIAPPKQLLPLIGMFLITAIFFLQFLPNGWLEDKYIQPHRVDDYQPRLDSGQALVQHDRNRK